METLAAVMTPKGTGAISSIRLAGPKAPQIIEKVFKPIANKPLTLKKDKILVGHIVENGRTIDHVVVGCEGTETFSINCHGNPLIVAEIMRLLQENSAKPVTAEETLKQYFTESNQPNTITLEAQLAQIKSVTLEGTKIILNQTGPGLVKTLTTWLDDIDSTSLAEIYRQTDQILDNSQTARLIINGCKVVITGPPNSGKSTLLNCLCGRQKSIVTDIPGTTRDWVGATCRIEGLLMELFDTAGLAEHLASKTSIDKAAQKKTEELLNNADLVLLVLDGSNDAEQLTEEMLSKITRTKVLVLLNKSDLPAKFDEKKLPENLGKPLRISAKYDRGIEQLITQVCDTFGVSGFDLKTPVCFNNRQENLLKQLANAKSSDRAAQIISELLNGRLPV
jgi:tRNA modification GTPase